MPIWSIYAVETWKRGEKPYRAINRPWCIKCRRVMDAYCYRPGHVMYDCGYGCRIKKWRPPKKLAEVISIERGRPDTALNP
jgi:hypothetical protein